MLHFGRHTLSNPQETQALEWLVTNGLGGYASGTVSLIPSRSYHGLLVAAFNPPQARTLLVNKLDERAVYAGRSFVLHNNRWDDGFLETNGLTHLESFYLDAGMPVWRYAFMDALIEKRLWMKRGENSTYVQYRLLRASDTLEVNAKLLINHRSHHASTRANDFTLSSHPLPDGLRLQTSNSSPLFVRAAGVSFTPQAQWMYGLYWQREDERGLIDSEDSLHAADLTFQLNAGDAITVVMSTCEDADITDNSLHAFKQHQQQLLQTATPLTRNVPAQVNAEELELLILAADQFVVTRPVAGTPGVSVIAGYPWFADWGRDTMIALPGLLLATGRVVVARQVLDTFARFVDKGMLPNRFPAADEAPEYNTVDAALWYVEAVRAYVAKTQDVAFLKELFPVLKSVIDWHVRGTRYNIKLDEDGLLYAGEAGQQLTWMDAKVDDWVVTARTGKPVEVNALWYNALRSMAAFAGLLEVPDTFTALAERTRQGFARFWSEKGYCFDVLDTPEGNDGRLRPNQLLAVSLHYSPLSTKQQAQVVHVCARELVCSHGLRSLSADDPAYQGHYGGDRFKRDAAYHQGTVWAWLIGPFAQAHYRVHGDTQRVYDLLRPLLTHVRSHCLGSISEVFDGDAPHEARGAFAQAWSVGEVLRVIALLTEPLSSNREDVT